MIFASFSLADAVNATVKRRASEMSQGNPRECQSSMIARHNRGGAMRRRQRGQRVVSRRPTCRTWRRAPDEITTNYSSNEAQTIIAKRRSDGLMGCHEGSCSMTERSVARSRTADSSNFLVLRPSISQSVGRNQKRV